MKNITTLAFFWLLVTTVASAQDRVDLEGTSIIGNRELPKVLYIVPWEKPDPNNLLDRPVGSLMDEVLGALDRDIFRRQVEYYELIESDSAATATLLR